jgi:exonuclease VII large subunit
VLDRGYSLTLDDGGNVVREASALKCGDRIRTRFADGEISATVDEIAR